MHIGRYMYIFLVVILHANKCWDSDRTANKVVISTYSRVSIMAYTMSITSATAATTLD